VKYWPVDPHDPRWNLLQDRRKDAWAAGESLTASRVSTPCFNWLLRGKTKCYSLHCKCVTLPEEFGSVMDHVDTWLRRDADGEIVARVISTQPYSSTDCPEFSKVLDAARAELTKLLVRVEYKHLSGWWYPGFTSLVLFEKSVT